MKKTPMIAKWLESCRNSSTLTLVVVSIALFLDHMLLTVVAPIIPEYLLKISQESLTNVSSPLNSNNTYDNSTQTDATHNGNEESLAVGLLFASKAFVQLLVNPFIGPLTNKIGYHIPMMIGFVIMFLSTLVFAFGESYIVLLAARSIQGAGSSCTTVAGLGLLALKYPDDEKRGKAMGYALGGIALGVLVGPPFGGVMYEFFDKSAPFLALAGLTLIDGVLQLLLLQPKEKSVGSAKSTPILTLVCDPYIMLAAGALAFANGGIAMLEPSLPVRIMERMGSSRWERGAAFIPASLGYLVGTNFFAPLSHFLGRWLATFFGLVGCGIGLALVPLAQTIWHLVFPLALFGACMGLVDCSIMPHLGYLVDTRHTSVYGSVYAIGDIALCLGFFVGPTLTGVLQEALGFDWMLYSVGIATIAYAPFMFFLRSPPTREGRMNDETTVTKF